VAIPTKLTPDTPALRLEHRDHQVNSLPHQQEMIGALEKGGFQPHTGPNLTQFLGHDIGGMQTEGDMARMHLGPSGQAYLTKHDPPSGSAGGRFDYTPYSSHEVAYHNLAHAWGLGQHVPAMVAVPGSHSTQEFRRDYTMPSSPGLKPFKGHPNGRWSYSPEDEAYLLRAHARGEPQRLMALDYVAGNGDRHDQNFLFPKDRTSDGPMMHIDGGMAFSEPAEPQYGSALYQPTGTHNLAPGLAGHEELHPEFRNWVKGLDPSHIDRALSQTGLPDAEEKAQFARDRLNTLKRAMTTPRIKTHADLMKHLYFL
jgi:hypothetical protein